MWEIKKLRVFSKNRFIISRAETKEVAYSYKNVLEVVEAILNDFHLLKVPHSVGFALYAKGHSSALCAILLGILNHGGYFFPLQTNAPAAVIREHLRTSRVQFVISDDESWSELLEVKRLNEFDVFGERFFLSSVKAAAIDFRLRLRDLCYIIATSGSTGAPKLVHVPNASIEPNINALSKHLNITSADVIYLCAPLTFDPFVVEFFLALQNGATLLIIPQELRLLPSKLLNLLFSTTEAKQNSSVTVLQITPSIFRLFGFDNIQNIILESKSTLRVLLLGGEQFPARRELVSWLPSAKHKTTTKIFNIYGITEVSCWSTMHECTSDENELEANYPLGLVIDDETILQIVDSAGQVLSGAVEGELEIGSATRKCYIPQVDTGQEEFDKCVTKDAVVFRSTGDLVRRNEKGDIYYSGRKDFVIKRLGKLLNLETLSAKIKTILCDQRALQVICMWQEQQKMLICYLCGASITILSKHILMQQLCDYEKPDKFVHVENFPFNAHGKIDRRALLQTLDLKKERKQPLELFENFLQETLGISINSAFETSDDQYGTISGKRTKHALNCSFLTAGGTSFQALFLSTEIGEMLESPEARGSLLEMLLNENVPLMRITDLLRTAKLIVLANNYNLQPLPSNCYQLKFVWRTDLRKCVDAAPAICGSCICVGSHSHLLLTLDCLTGKELSRLELSDRIECKVEFNSTGCLALVGCYDGNLYAFKPGESAVLWHVYVGGMIKAKPLLCAESVVVGCYAPGCNLVCISLKDQNILWQCKVGTRGIFVAPIKICESTLLACCLDGTYKRVNLNTGAFVWSQRCDSPIFSTPALILDAKQLILAEVNGTLRICDVETGKKLHAYKVAGNIFSSITTYTKVMGEVLILFGCYDEHIFCLNYKPHAAEATFKETDPLNLLWKFRLNSPIYAAPLVVSYQNKLFVVVCSTKGLLLVLTLRTGDLVAREELAIEIFSTPCGSKAEGTFYFGGRDNFLYCFSLS